MPMKVIQQPLTVVPRERLLVPRDRLVRLPEVSEMTGCAKSTIYDLMRAGKFPKSVRLNARMVAWPESSILTWVQDRIAEAQAKEVQ